MEKIRGMEKIVVGVDGSKESLDALRWAVAETKLRSASLSAVCVWEYPYAYTGIPDGEMVMPVETVETGARSTLDSAIDTIVDDPDVRESIERVVVCGNPAHVLREQSKGAELLVVGARGRGGFLGLLLGSTSDALARHAECPVVVVRTV